MASPPTANDFSALCTDVINLTPKELGNRAWYLIIATILTSSPNPTLLGPFYTFITTTTQQPPLPLPTNPKQTIPLHLRALLLKLVTLIGAPAVVTATASLAGAEGTPQPKAATSVLSRQYTDLSLAHLSARGEQCINSIYGPLLPTIFSSLGSHKSDMEHMELSVVYGLYLSDTTVLTSLETETSVLCAMLCSGLRSPSLWHVRGLGRLLGARGSEAGEAVKDVLRGVKMAAMRTVEWCGPQMEGRVGGLEGWVNVGDVARELGGWGDDEFHDQGGGAEES